MKNIFGFLCLILVLSIMSCGDDELQDSNVTLNFKLEYQGAPIHAFQEIAYPLGYDMFLTKFSMFLTDAELISGSNSEPLFDAIFVDFLKDINDLDAASAGISIPLSGVPLGQFEQLRFNLGVTPENNAKNPSDFPNSNALANNSEYWAGWSSYIFHKIEGKLDPNSDGDFDTNLALHIGSDDAFRQRTFNKNINIVDGENNIIELTIDVADVLNIDGSYFDLVARPQVHSEEVLPEVLPLMDQLIESIK